MHSKLTRSRLPLPRRVSHDDTVPPRFLKSPYYRRTLPAELRSRGEGGDGRATVTRAIAILAVLAALMACEETMSPPNPGDQPSTPQEPTGPPDGTGGPPTPAPAQDVPIPESNLVLTGFGRIDAEPQAHANGVARERLYFTSAEWIEGEGTVTLRLIADRPVSRVWVQVSSADRSERTWYAMDPTPPAARFDVRFRRVAEERASAIAEAFPQSSHGLGSYASFAYEGSDGSFADGGSCLWCKDLPFADEHCGCCQYKLGPNYLLGGGCRF